MLSEVAEVNPSRSPNSCHDDEVAFIPMAGVSEDGELIASEIRNRFEVSSGYTAFQKGDVLLAKITPCFENGKSCITTGLARDYGFGSTEFHVLRPGPAIAADYLHQLVRSPEFRLHGERRMTGSAGQRRVPAEYLREYAFVLPSLEQQRKIAARLEKADAIRKKRIEALKLLDKLQRSAFLDLFGSIFSTHSDGWECLSDCTDFIDYRGKTPEKSTSGIRLITAKNVRDGVINLEPAEFISEETYGYWMTRGYPQSGDVLFTTEAPLANVAVLRTAERVSVGQRLIAIRPRQGLRPDFLSWALRQEVIKQDIFSRATGSTVKGIRSAELVQVRVPIAEEAAQVKFETLVEKLDHQKVNMTGFVREAESLFQSLQKQAFA